MTIFFINSDRLSLWKPIEIARFNRLRSKYHMYMTTTRTTPTINNDDDDANTKINKEKKIYKML